MFATSKMKIKKADPWTQIPGGLSSRSVGHDVGIPKSRKFWRCQLLRKDIEYGDSNRKAPLRESMPQKSVERVVKLMRV